MWEYTVENIISNKVINKEKLGKLGREGWELITLRGNMGIFKRPIENNQRGGFRR